MVVLTRILSDENGWFNRSKTMIMIYFIRVVANLLRDPQFIEMREEEEEGKY